MVFEVIFYNPEKNWIISKPGQRIGFRLIRKARKEIPNLNIRLLRDSLESLYLQELRIEITEQEAIKANKKTKCFEETNIVHVKTHENALNGLVSLMEDRAPRLLYWYIDKTSIKKAWINAGYPDHMSWEDLKKNLEEPQK